MINDRTAIQGKSRLWKPLLFWMRDERLQDIVLQVLNSRIQGDGHCAHRFDEDVIKSLVKSAAKQFMEEPTLLTLEGPIHVVGDIHGDLYTLTRLLQCFGYPPSTRYLFLGDYVDRGNHSCEVIILLYALKLLFPHQVYLLRGNHETKQNNHSCNFRDDCSIHLSPHIYTLFLHSFAAMPLAAVVSNNNQKGVFCVHGGISPALTTLAMIESIARPLRSLAGDHGDLLWSDPSQKVDYFEDSPRGVGFLYGEEALNTFLTENNLSAIVRGHESCKHGFSHNLGSRVPLTTIFSSANYCGKGNEAAVAIIGLDCSVNPLVVPREPKRMLYPEFLLLAALEKVDSPSFDVELGLQLECASV